MPQRPKPPARSVAPSLDVRDRLGEAADDLAVAHASGSWKRATLKPSSIGTFTANTTSIRVRISSCVPLVWSKMKTYSSMPAITRYAREHPPGDEAERAPREVLDPREHHHVDDEQDRRDREQRDRRTLRHVPRQVVGRVDAAGDDQHEDRHGHLL